MESDKLNERIVPDILTGGEMTEYWKDDGTFYMQIPHKAIPIPQGFKPPKCKVIKNNDGSTTYELLKD